jgi:hypothetical protein
MGTMFIRGERGVRSRNVAARRSVAIGALLLVATSGIGFVTMSNSGARAQTPTPSGLQIANELVSGPVSGPGVNQSTMSYEIRVVNPTTAPVPYSLSQALKFGVGITINSAAVSQAPAGVTAAAWNGTSTATLTAAPRNIGSGAVDVWRVTVAATANTAARAVGSTTGDCTLAGAETGTGFLARATVTDGAASVVEDRCSPAIQPRIVKIGTVTAGPDVGSSTTVRAGDTVDWRIQFDNTQISTGTGSITDLLPGGTTFVPGSLELPGRWTGAFSTDAGATYATPEPVTGVNGLKIAIPVGEKVGYESGSAEFPKPPKASSTQSGTGGDGYLPEAMGANLYNVFHHQVARVFCTVKETGSGCNNGTTGYFFTRTAGAVAKSSTTVLASDPTVTINLHGLAASDPATKHIWIAGSDSSGAVDGGTVGGFACLDMSVSPPKGCTPNAWVPAATGVNNTADAKNPNFTMSSFDKTTRRAFAVDHNFNVYCLDMATGTLCAGYTVTDNTFPRPVNYKANIPQGIGMLMPGTTKFILTGHAKSVNWADFMTCIDTTTGARCVGWPVNPISVPGDDLTATAVALVLPRFTAPNVTVADGACFFHTVPTNGAGLPGSPTKFVTCTSLADGTSMALPPNFYNAMPTNTGLAPSIELAGDYALTASGKLINAWYVFNSANRWTCYDFAIGNACTGWVGGKDIAGVWDFPYGTRVDDADPECIWTLGDVSNLRSFDAGSGGPCSSSIARFTVTPRRFYCAASNPVISAWTTVTIGNLPNTAYTTAILTIKDTAGSIVGTYNNVDVTADLADGSLDISAIPYAGTTTALSFNLQLRGANSVLFSATPTPFIAAAWDGPPVEMCFKTTIADVCTVSQVNNSAVLGFKPDSGGSVDQTSSRSFEYLASSACLVTTKSVASGPTANGNGTYSIAYDVGVKNTSPGRSVYDLTDTLHFGAGVTVSGTPTVANTSPGAVATNAAWNGITATNIVTAESIPGTTTHTYRANVVANAPASLAAASSDCTLAGAETGTGLQNGATASQNGTASSPAVACAPLPSIEIAKTVASGPIANANGTWTISYNLAVTNSGAGAGTYALADALKFGTGITVVSAAVTTSPVGAALATPAWNGSTNTTVVAARALAAGLTETYVATVVASAPGGVSPAAADCSLGAGETGTGLSNDATTTANGAPSSTSSACAPVTNTINAVDDSFGKITGGGTTPSVLGNDTLNGAPATIASVTLTPGTSPNPGLLMNPDGTITINPTTPPGSYSYPYKVCSTVDPTVCDTAIATVSVGSVIKATDDVFGVVAGGGTTSSVLGNDTLNGNAATPDNVVLTPGISPNPGLVMNPDGTITVAANTPPGTYSYPYTICSKVDPTVCSTAIATVTTPSKVDAADNDFGTVTGGGTTPSVLSGDTLNGNPATTTNITLTPGISPNPGLLMNSDGSITIAPNTPPGTYTYPYKICSKVDPTQCDSAIAIVKVGSVINAPDDVFGVVAGGGTTSSVLGNDTLNGNPATLANVNLTPGVSPNPGLVMNSDGTITVAPTTPPGTYSYPYTICSKVDPTVCDTAIAIITTPSKIAAVDNNFGTVAGGGTTPSVLTSDTLNGNPATTANITVTTGASPNPGLVMNPDGTITVAADTPPGTYAYPYKICSKVDPTECDSATAIVNVGSVVDAVDDDFGTVTGGGTTASVLTGDTLNGKPATSANVNLTPGASPNPGLVMNPDGTITIAADTPPGTYSYPYTICSKVDPLVCDTATAIVRVGSVINATDNDFGTMKGGSKSPSVLIGDTLNGTPVTVDNVTITPGISPTPGLVMNPDGTITLSGSARPGLYTYPYTICSKIDPTICQSAVATLAVGEKVRLPITGSDIGRLGFLASAFVLVGLAVARTGRRRKAVRSV